MKKTLIALLVFVIAYMIAYIALDRWAERRLAESEAVWRTRIAKQREADGARRVPVLSGAPREENACALERALIDQVNGTSLTTTARDGLAKAASASPFEPLPDEVKLHVKLHAGLLRGLDEATACALADPENDYEQGFEMAIPPLMACRMLSNLSIAAGHERAQGRDLVGAADRYLASARFGVDQGTGTLIQSMIGSAIIHSSLGALGRLVAEAPSRAALPLDHVDARLAALSDALPAPAKALEGERLFAGSIAAFLRKEGMLSLMRTSRHLSSAPSGPSLDEMLALLIPGRAVVAQALPVFEGAHDEVSRIAALPERAARDKGFADMHARLGASWNPLVAIATPNFGPAIESIQALRARLAVVRFAIALERRNATGVAASAPDAPEDPCAAPAKLRAEVTADGAGYRVYSAGPNGKDDGGKDDDIVVERKASK